MFAVELNSASKSFSFNQVIKDLSLSLEKGRFYALLGQNGAGKSTLIKLLMRYSVLTSGSGRVLGVPLDEDSDRLGRMVAYVSEDIDYVLPITISEFFAFYRALHPRWNQDEFDANLKALSINPTKTFAELSRGQKMQVALSAALATRCELLLLDEITAVLDAFARSHFLKILRNRVDAGGTVLLSTNMVTEVHEFATDVVLLADGRTHLVAPVAEVGSHFRKLRQPKGVQHPIFADPDCMEIGLNSDGSVSFIMNLECAARYTISPELLDRRKVTLSDAFIYYTKSRTSAGKPSCALGSSPWACRAAGWRLRWCMWQACWDFTFRRIIFSKICPGCWLSPYRGYALPPRSIWLR
ncbi:MAG: ABC transporter ATP-binding protein [Deltaproteobacteria bacterium]|nr:ABC transporter ATP-binding protein [Deltaproteobacteria bacterium]